MSRIGQLALLFVALITVVSCQNQSSPPSTCVNPVLLSRGAPVTASANPKEATAVTDGRTQPFWNAGGYPPQWVEIDLGTADLVHHVTVIPEQTPSGYTEHRITGTTATAEARVLGDLKGETRSGGEFTLTVSDEAGRGIRKVRVETVKTPSSWVAWREIEIYGCR